MSAGVVGIRLQLGYPGSLTRSSDAVIQNRVASGVIPFGGGVLINPDNTVSAFGDGGGDARFIGFAVRIVKQQMAVLESVGSYRDTELTDILTRGSIAVSFRGTGTPTAAGSLYIRTALNAAFLNAQIGDVEAVADGTNNVLISNARFTTGIVQDGLVEVTVTERRI